MSAESREETSQAAASRGPVVHPKALVESQDVGAGTRVWAFAHILPGARIGRDCNICDGVFIENDVIVGDRVTVKCGVQLWDGVTLEDDVFVGPNATFTNDPFPRSRVRPGEFSRTIVRRGASIGANATLLPGITIGADSMVGAGAVVTRDVPDRAIVVGNPARVMGVAGEGGRNGEAGRKSVPPPMKPLSVAGARLVTLPSVADDRGLLTYGQVEQQLPFVPRRFFVISDVGPGKARGGHGHRTAHQFLICLRGRCTIRLDDGLNQDEVLLSSPGIGLHVPPGVWNDLFDFSTEAVVLCFASEQYDPAEYIRDRAELRGGAQGR